MQYGDDYDEYVVWTETVSMQSIYGLSALFPPFCGGAAAAGARPPRCL